MNNINNNHICKLTYTLTQSYRGCWRNGHQLGCNKY